MQHRGDAAMEIIGSQKYTSQKFLLLEMSIAQSFIFFGTNIMGFFQVLFKLGTNYFILNNLYELLIFYWWIIPSQSASKYKQFPQFSARYHRNGKNSFFYFNWRVILLGKIKYHKHFDFKLNEHNHIFFLKNDNFLDNIFSQ